VKVIASVVLFISTLFMISAPTNTPVRSVVTTSSHVERHVVVHIPVASRSFVRPQMPKPSVEPRSPHPTPRASPIAVPSPPAPRVITSTKAPRKPHVSSGCTSSNWRATMTSDEVWIDTRESTMNPRAINPSGARGLGQLKPSTYAILGLVPDWDPCHELIAQRAYIAERYGSEDTAVAWWRSHSWY
jgi:hypothetical protein